MTPKKYILHIGTHKTGTSSLQQAFFANRHNLHRHGVVYPETGLHPNAHAHYKLSFALRGEKPGRIGLPEDWKNRLREEMASAQISVVSSELFHEKIQDPESVATLFPPDQTLIVMYLREPVSYMASLYQQRIKTNNLSMNLEDFVKYNGFSYVNTIDKWSQIFGKENVILRLYDRETLLDGDIVADFAYLVRPGLESMFPRKAYECNLGIAGNLIFIKRILNCFITLEESKSIIPEWNRLAPLDPTFFGKIPVSQRIANLITFLYRGEINTLEEHYDLSIKPLDKPISAPASPDHERLAQAFQKIYFEAKNYNYKMLPFLKLMGNMFETHELAQNP